MKKRPLPVALISYVFIIAGTIGIIYHATELAEIMTRPEVTWVLAVRALAIVGGIFVMKRANWARWLLVLWIAYHVVISFYHTPMEIIMHFVIMVILVAALFNPKANRYFMEKLNPD